MFLAKRGRNSADVKQRQRRILYGMEVRRLNHGVYRNSTVYGNLTRRVKKSELCIRLSTGTENEHVKTFRDQSAPALCPSHKGEDAKARGPEIPLGWPSP
uniref:Uncharacterized protein n=1 Tax=Vespula pensylvanica TaxID=30213 RepID=A0A834UDS5_VESPE|nr:hypothetical protein H0235_005256 [Vespula pensylvanica]